MTRKLAGVVWANIYVDSHDIPAHSHLPPLHFIIQGHRQSLDTIQKIILQLSTTAGKKYL